MFARRRILPARKPVLLPESLTVGVGAEPIEIGLRASDRATRLLLKFDASRDRFELVVPRGARLSDAETFARAQGPWMRARLGSAPPRIPFEPGQAIPVFDVPHPIVHRPGGGKPVRIENGEIIVTGGAEHVSRRVRDFLRAQARAELTPRARAYAAELGKPIQRIGLTDPRSRWGSCSAKGSLSFSWRLVFAPLPVLDYVVAHEVAHLIELNHSPRFWAQVNRLVGPHGPYRDWLRANATRLMRLG
jgi:predicted metal-dependent hydrolase